MLALLGIGVALILGVMVRISSIGGAVLLLFMYLAEWPLNAVDPETGFNTANNPIMDDHIIYAVVMIMLMLFTAERTWGLGKWWESTEPGPALPLARLTHGRTTRRPRSTERGLRRCSGITPVETRAQRPSLGATSRVPAHSGGRAHALGGRQPCRAGRLTDLAGLDVTVPTRLGGEEPDHAAGRDGRERIDEGIDEVAVVVAPPQHDDVRHVVELVADHGVSRGSPRSRCAVSASLSPSAPISRTTCPAAKPMRSTWTVRPFGRRVTRAHAYPFPIVPGLSPEVVTGSPLQPGRHASTSAHLGAQLRAQRGAEGGPEGAPTALPGQRSGGFGVHVVDHGVSTGEDQALVTVVETDQEGGPSLPRHAPRGSRRCGPALRRGATSGSVSRRPWRAW